MEKKLEIAKLKKLHREWLHKTTEMGYDCSLEEYLVDNHYAKIEDVIGGFVNHLNASILDCKNKITKLSLLERNEGTAHVKLEYEVRLTEITAIREWLRVELAEKWGIEINGL